jgi:hypothetical protein
MERMPSTTPALGGEEGVCILLLDEYGDRMEDELFNCG